MNAVVEVYVNLQRTNSSKWTTSRQNWRYSRQNWSNSSTATRDGSMRHQNYLRRTNAERSLLNKKRVIKMLLAVVLEFFICWTPLYTINTIALFDPSIVYDNLGYTAISFFQLLAYTSSCCNPITYCFMNCGFRKSFLNLFRCCKRRKEGSPGVGASETNLDMRWSGRNQQSQQQH